MIMFPGIEATADGWVGLSTNSAQKLEDLVVLVGRADLLGDTDVRSDPCARRSPSAASSRGWSTRRPRYWVGPELRIPVAPIGNGKMLPGLDHFVSRSVRRRALTAVTAPRPPYAIDGRRRLPGIDSHSGRADTARVALDTALRSGPWSMADDLPLAGLKVLDATAWWAGPARPSLLAALGADVVHVESIRVIDGMRPAAALPFASPWMVVGEELLLLEHRRQQARHYARSRLRRTRSRALPRARRLGQQYVYVCFVATVLLNRARETLGGQALRAFSRTAPPNQGRDDPDIARREDPKGNGYSQRRYHQPAERRPGGTPDIEGDAIGGGRAVEIAWAPAPVSSPPRRAK